MSTVLAIDPGNEQSAYAVIDAHTRRPLRTHINDAPMFGKVPNHELLHLVDRLADHPQRPHAVAIEMVASYGMPVGREVFETCVWIGRFAETIDRRWPRIRAQFIYRQPVKLHHCHTAKAKDSNIVQALVDRFAPGQPNKGKGTKADPGWFHGFAADVWQAYALAVYVADTLPASEAAGF